MKSIYIRAVCTWFIVSVLAAIISTAYMLDYSEDHSNEWQRSAELLELQATEAGTARREAAAQALCTQERGPNSEARWLADGSLVCTAGRRVVRASL